MAGMGLSQMGLMLFVIISFTCTPRHDFYAFWMIDHFSGPTTIVDLLQWLLCVFLVKHFWRLLLWAQKKTYLSSSQSNFSDLLPAGEKLLLGGFLHLNALTGCLVTGNLSLSGIVYQWCHWLSGLQLPVQVLCLESVAYSAWRLGSDWNNLLPVLCIPYTCVSLAPCINLLTGAFSCTLACVVSNFANLYIHTYHREAVLVVLLVTFLEKLLSLVPVHYLPTLFESLRIFGLFGLFWESQTYMSDYLLFIF